MTRERIVEETIIQKKNRVLKSIDDLKPRLIELAKRIHQNPELQFQEHKASAWLSGLAGEFGFRIEKPLGGLETAFKASFEGRSNGPSVAFLAEYDALPDVGHACGHNLIGVASLGAALGLSPHIIDLPGTIQLIGTPAEEGGGGKVSLVNEGVFDHTDVALMFHPSNETVPWKYSLARHKLAMEFVGRAAHAATEPHEGVNALDAVIQTFNNINALRQQIRDDARIHGIITQGGTAPNVIPDHSSALFYIRALDDAYCDQLLEKVKLCAQGASLATGAELKLHSEGFYKTVKTNHTLVKAFEENLKMLGWVFDPYDPKDKIGSTDLGHVSQKIPAIHPYMKIGPGSLICHSKKFAEASLSDRGMDTMIDAAKALSLTALDVLLNPAMFEKIKQEFKMEN